MSRIAMRKFFVIAALLALLGCREKRDPEFRALAEKALGELTVKNASHLSAWGLGRSERWDLNQSDGKLIFTFPDKIVTCEAQIIGSYDTSKEMWLWAWDNPAVNTNLTVASKLVREFGKEHGYKKLTEAEWKATEEDAWDMAAIATLECNAQGAYRGPAGDSYVFMTFTNPKIAKPQAAATNGGGGTNVSK